MKKRILALLLSAVMALSLVPLASAAESEAVQAAYALYAQGLFKGTGTNADGTPVFDLDRTPTRHEAVTMLVRLLGKDAEAQAGAWETPFTDVADWAKPYVGYAYTNGLTTGTSATTYGGDALVDAAQYLTFVLRALGYTSGTDFQWDKPWELSDKIGLTSGRYNAGTVSFTRGDVAVISQTSLSARPKTKEITAADIQGTWKDKRGDGNDCCEYTFSGNNFIRSDIDKLTVGREYVGDNLHYDTGTFTIENNVLHLLVKRDALIIYADGRRDYRGTVTFENNITIADVTKDTLTVDNGTEYRKIDISQATITKRVQQEMGISGGESGGQQTAQLITSAEKNDIWKCLLEIGKADEDAGTQFVPAMTARMNGKVAEMSSHTQANQYYAQANKLFLAVKADFSISKTNVQKIRSICKKYPAASKLLSKLDELERLHDEVLAFDTFSDEVPSVFTPNLKQITSILYETNDLVDAL